MSLWEVTLTFSRMKSRLKLSNELFNESNISELSFDNLLLLHTFLDLA